MNINPCLRSGPVALTPWQGADSVVEGLLEVFAFLWPTYSTGQVNQSLYGENTRMCRK